MQYMSRDGKSKKEEIELSRSEIDHLIDEWIIGRNAERNRAILKRKLFDGITYEDLADEFDISVRQAKRIVRTCEIKIFKHLK
jgi:DNA-directed RNA polymerase specialized sigma24 family protein